MASLGESSRLSDAEAADLESRVERFRAAWRPDGSTGLEWYLPPPGSRHRPAVLVQIVIADMERRGAAGLPFRAESYVNTFPEELSTNQMPPAVLAVEFRLRHKYTDKPPLAEYQRWFPDQFDAMVAQLGPTAPGDNTPVTAVTAVNPFPGNATPSGRHGTLNDGRRSGSHRPADPRSRPPGSGGPYNVLPADAQYQLVRRIGSGAFGEVFEALAPGGVKVAVKRILRSVDHPASKSEKDALEAIKWLSHPFLLKTNAYWVFDDKLVIVMELADGSLTDRIAYHQERGLPGMPPEELVPLFEQAGEALDYLHSQSVSHRDVKPENILILQGYAKVADFGLARLHEHTLTVVNNTVGTPAYMAPEMWQQKVSLQSDQYSLAATYVRARIGRHLFETNILVDQANAHIHETPNLDPIPEAEQTVLLRALAKNPDDRYPSCLEFAKALRAAVFPPPPPPTPAGPRTRWWDNGLVRTLAGAVFTALLVAAVIVMTRPPVEQAKEKAREEKKEPEKQPVVVVQPQKKFATYPTGWEPVGADGSELIGDKNYHHALTRKVGDRELTAYLVPVPVGNELTPFYMLEHKITLKVFATVWAEIDQSPMVLNLRDKKLAPGEWQKEEGSGRVLVKYEDGGRKFTIAEADVDLPVLGVTVPEALLVAEHLGGRLPLHKQWLKATGLLDGAKNGPAGEELKLPMKSDEELRLWKRDRFLGQNLALGLPGPVPVTDKRASGDKSPWKIRQLVTNGQEWLGQEMPNSSGRVSLTPLPPGDQEVIVVGHGPREDAIDTGVQLQTEAPGSYPWNTVKGVYAGFRIVIEPK